MPKVFGYDASGETIGLAFMMMELILGNTAMDSFGGWKFHNREIPSEHRGTFSRNISSIQVSYRLVLFNRVAKSEAGCYGVHPVS